MPSHVTKETMHLKGIVSSNVAAVGYDSAARTMRVQFHSGGTYDYLNVDAALYQEMLQPHPWRRVGTRVKAHGFKKIA